MYETLKNFAPETPALPSFSLETVMGVPDGQPCKGQGGGTAAHSAARQACSAEGIALVETGKRYAFGSSPYPCQGSTGPMPSR